MPTRLADPGRAGRAERPAVQGLHARDEHVVFPRERKTPLDEQLLSVAGDDLAALAPEQDASQPDLDVVLGGRADGLGQGRQEAVRHRREPRLVGKGPGFLRRRGFEFDDFGNAAVGPSSNSFAGFGRLQGDRGIVPAFDLGQQVGPEGDGAGGTRGVDVQADSHVILAGLQGQVRSGGPGRGPVARLRGYGSAASGPLKDLAEAQRGACAGM